MIESVAPSNCPTGVKVTTWPDLAEVNFEVISVVPENNFAEAASPPSVTVITPAAAVAAVGAGTTFGESLPPEAAAAPTATTPSAIAPIWVALADSKNPAAARPSEVVLAAGA